jgi:hypothetical protein
MRSTSHSYFSRWNYSASEQREACKKESMHKTCGKVGVLFGQPVLRHCWVNCRSGCYVSDYAPSAYIMYARSTHGTGRGAKMWALSIMCYTCLQHLSVYGYNILNFSIQYFCTGSLYKTADQTTIFTFRLNEDLECFF